LRLQSLFSYLRLNEAITVVTMRSMEAGKLSLSVLLSGITFASFIAPLQAQNQQSVSPAPQVGLPASSQAPTSIGAPPMNKALSPGITAGANSGVGQAINPGSPLSSAKSSIGNRQGPLSPVTIPKPTQIPERGAADALNSSQENPLAGPIVAPKQPQQPSWDPATTPVLGVYQEPDLDKAHDQNSTILMGQIRLHNALRSDQFKPIRLEIAYDQSISLPEAIQYATDNNLAIKISNENLKYQHFVLYSNYANALPNFTMAYNLTGTNIYNESVRSLAKVFLARVTYPVFQGGSVVQGILGQYYREKGWRSAYKASISDELLDVYQKYNTLLLNRILLQIRGKAVEVSEEQVRVDRSKERQGTGTRYAVMQSEAQLSTDRQALLQQEVTMRQSALALNFTMNSPMAVNLVPIEDAITEEPLFSEDASVDQLVTLALLNRPELREYEAFRVAAGRNIQVAAAPLYPQVSFFQQYSYTDTTTNTSSSSSASTTSSSSTSGAGVFGGLFQTYQQGLAIVWSFNNLGLTSVANIYAAASLNRQARIQANQELQTIIQQVRSDYLSWRAAREQIDNAAHGVRASLEELRMAKLRLNTDVGTNLEVIQGQRDYINSLTTQAQAIVNSNLAQAQLLHDTGLISVSTLLHGYKGNIDSGAKN
jgi:outer membrane protein TolC